MSTYILLNFTFYYVHKSSEVNDISIVHLRNLFLHNKVKDTKVLRSRITQTSGDEVIRF